MNLRMEAPGESSRSIPTLRGELEGVPTGKGTSMGWHPTWFSVVLSRSFEPVGPGPQSQIRRSRSRGDEPADRSSSRAGPQAFGPGPPRARRRPTSTGPLTGGRKRGETGEGRSPGPAPVRERGGCP